MKKKNLLDFDENTKNVFDIKWNSADFTFSILGGQVRFTPEMVIDLDAYYNIKPVELFEFVKTAVDKTGVKEELDVRVAIVNSFHRTRETIFKMSVETTNDKIELLSTFFSTGPIVPAKMENISGE